MGIGLRWPIVTRVLASIGAALALFFGAVGCGGDSNDFKDQYNEAVRPLSSLGDQIGASLSGGEGQSNQALAAQYEKLAEEGHILGQPSTPAAPSTGNTFAT